MADQEEKLWLVDENDQPTGEGWQWRSPVLRANWKNFRVVNAFIRRSDGKLWIPRRVPTKKIFPSALDMSVAGHVEYGESYEVAFAREAMEEANIDIGKVPVKYLGKLSPYEIPELSAFQMVWEIQLQKEPNYNKNDFSEAFWLTPQEVWDWIASGEPSKTDLPYLVKAFYSKEIGLN